VRVGTPPSCATRSSGGALGGDGLEISADLRNVVQNDDSLSGAVGVRATVMLIGVGRRETERPRSDGSPKALFRFPLTPQIRFTESDRSGSE